MTQRYCFIRNMRKPSETSLKIFGNLVKEEFLQKTVKTNVSGILYNYN